MTDPTTAPCVAPGCHHNPAPGQLCPGHHAKLGQALADIADDLTADAATPMIGWRTGGHSGGLASERDPGNLRLMTARGLATEVLAAWADWVRTERDLTCPTVQRTKHVDGRLVTCRAPAPPDPAVDRDLLARNFDWIVGQASAADFWCQIRALWSQLRGDRPVRRCTCGGPVWSDRGAGWCSWCGESWSGAPLLALAPPEEGAS